MMLLSDPDGVYQAGGRTVGLGDTDGYPAVLAGGADAVQRLSRKAFLMEPDVYLPDGPSLDGGGVDGGEGEADKVPVAHVTVEIGLQPGHPMAHRHGTRRLPVVGEVVAEVGDVVQRIILLREALDLAAGDRPSCLEIYHHPNAGPAGDDVTPYVPEDIVHVCLQGRDLRQEDLHLHDARPRGHLSGKGTMELEDHPGAALLQEVEGGNVRLRQETTDRVLEIA